MSKAGNAIKNLIPSLSIVVLVFASPVTAFADTAASTTTTDTSATASPASTTDTTETSSPAASSTTSTGSDTQASAASTTPSVTTDSTPSSTSSPTKPLSTTTGPTKPTGADSGTYHYNSATGMWENDYYIWNPATGQTQPKTPPTYSYNPDTGMWDTTKWVYDATQAKYIPNIISTAVAPAGALKSQPTATNSSNPSTPPSSKAGNGDFDLFYNSNISNNLTSSARSGDAAVISNTLGGNATSGNAQDIATIINLLQSASSLTGSNAPVTFISNIQGDVVGDLLINPDSIAPLKTGTATGQPSGLTVNDTTNTSVNNDINLAATSGNATIENNTKAGSATSGDATAVANVINLLNSAINSGQSFLGMVNIYGSLNGDILLPPGMLSALLSSNSGKSSDPASLNADFTNNQTINNNVNVAAHSGQAAVTQNTTAGNATSGDALTNMTVLNLTGREVVGSNDFLVFVNVLGTWVGLIMDAPAGTTAAEIGSGVLKNNTLLPYNTDINSTNNQTINNNISIAADSGDATVDHNTEAGNATTGDATASLNLLNIINSHLALSDWFGILFINVFGTWNGSFGIDTAAGTIPLNQPGSAHQANQKANSNGDKAVSVPVFRFMPYESGSTRQSSSAANSYGQPSASHLTNAHPEILGSTTQPTAQHKATAAATSVPKSSFNWTVMAAGAIAGAALLGAERLLAFRDSRLSK